jgi:Tfp pilus assembly protein PilV
MNIRAIGPADSPRCGFGTIEILIALSLFAVVLLSLGGLFMLAIASGAAAESASVATNLARARLEQLRALPASALPRENDATSMQQVPSGLGRPYTIRTFVDGSDPAFFDVTVTVSWRMSYGSACASRASGAGCTGRQATKSRTLQTRILQTHESP